MKSILVFIFFERLQEFVWVTGPKAYDKITGNVKNVWSTSVKDSLETTQKGWYKKWTHLHKAYLYFAGYATEAVKKENFIVWALTIKSTKRNEKNIKIS